MLAVDDAHWADPASLHFLGYLLRRLEGLSVLIVAAGRTPDPEGERLWQELAEDPAAEVLQPRALSEAAAGQVLRNRLGPEVEDQFAAACHQATGGNPLFLRELVAALVDAEIEPTAEASESVTTVGPPAVGRFVLHRLERLGPSATELARSVAVLGGTSLALAARAAGLERAEARRVADLLVRAEIFAPETRLGFAHPIVEAAIYEELLPGDRAARHLAAARLLEETGAPVERAATHLLKSRPTGDGRSVATCVPPRRARRNGRPGSVGGVSPSCSRGAAAEPERGPILCELGRLEITQDEEAGHDHLQEALQTPGDPAVNAEAAIWLSRAALIWGRPEWAATTLQAIDDQLATADAERALELEAEALTLTRLELSLRHLVDDRLRASSSALPVIPATTRSPTSMRRRSTCCAASRRLRRPMKSRQRWPPDRRLTPTPSAPRSRCWSGPSATTRRVAGSSWRSMPRGPMASVSGSPACTPSAR